MKVYFLGLKPPYTAKSGKTYYTGQVAKPILDGGYGLTGDSFECDASLYGQLNGLEPLTRIDADFSLEKQEYGRDVRYRVVLVGFTAMASVEE